MAVIIRAGDLRSRVQLQRSTQTRDAVGGCIQTWATYATVSAQFIESTSREAFRAMQVNAEVTHVIRIRYLAGVLATDRVLYGSRVLDIIQAEDEGQAHVALLIACKEAK